MIDRTQGPARALLSARQRINRDELEQLQKSGTLVIDDRRRPLYFDGRFLAARDLTRDQNYFLARQADLGRALGAGVVAGLTVSPGPNAFSVVISPGHGLTPSGEMVALPDALTIGLADMAETQRLNLAFRLSRLPHTPPRGRSGLFILALRPVEFTANPIASYPTSIDGDRSVEDGDIVEAVAVTLLPYRDEGATVDLQQRRARAAREIFMNDAEAGLPAGVLPLAMLALERNVVRWIDPYLVRREVGAEHGDILGFGFAPRAQREAQLFQYQQQLQDIMEQRSVGDGDQRFAASDYFYALPPAGSLPAAAINTADFTQTYFPPEVEVELSIVPQDELPALLEESLRLPPFDLTLGGEELESTSAIVLIPVERHRLRTLKSRLSDLARSLLPAAPGLVARRKPVEVLEGLRVARLFQPLVRPEITADSQWVSELNRAAQANDGLLWYVRRRNLSYRAEVVGAPVPVEGEEAEVEREVSRRIEAIASSGLAPDLSAVLPTVTVRGNAEIVSLLSSPTFERSSLLLAEAVREIAEARPETEGETSLTRHDIIRIAERFSEPEAGEGLARLETIRPEIRDNPEIAAVVVETGMVAELDRVARLLPEAERSTLAANLVEAAGRGETESVVRLINEGLRDVRLR